MALNTLNTHCFAPGAGLHPLILIPRSRMVNGMTFTTLLPDVTLPKSNLQGIFVLYVVSTKATITTQVPLAVWQFLPKVLSLSHFPQNPAGQAPVQPQKFPNGHRFQRCCASHQSAHRPKNIDVFRFVSKLNKPLGKLSSQPHTRTP